MNPASFTATVLENNSIAKDTKEAVFSIDNSQNIIFTAGQFFNIIIENKIIRAYSIASSPNLLPRFKICVKLVRKSSGEEGIGSGFLHSLKSGDTAKFSGPFGHFGQKFPQKNCTMIATGTGIAPMKSIIDKLREKDFPINTHLIFGVREEQHAFYREYFEKLSHDFLNFNFTLYISQPNTSIKLSGYTKKGRVTEFFSENHKNNDTLEYFKNREFLICGNPSMVKEVKTTLITKYSVDKKMICREAY